MLTKFRRFFYVKRRKRIIKTKKSKKDFDLYKQQALLLVNRRIEHFNKIYNFRYNAIRIKNTITRWGSCSSKGNLNFNYRIFLLPEKHSDYIIVHELCHLGEFNHSQKFWDLVKKTIPNYAEIKDELKHIGIGLL